MTAALYSDAERHRTVISDIIQILHRHTFAVELAARLLEKGILKPAALRRKLRLERVAMDAADLIRTIKDGKSSRATYRDHIRIRPDGISRRHRPETQLRHAYGCSTGV